MYHVNQTVYCGSSVDWLEKLTAFGASNKSLKSLKRTVNLCALLLQLIKIKGQLKCGILKFGKFEGFWWALMGAWLSWGMSRWKQSRQQLRHWELPLWPRSSCRRWRRSNLRLMPMLGEPSCSRVRLSWPSRSIKSRYEMPLRRCDRFLELTTQRHFCYKDHNSRLFYRVEVIWTFKQSFSKLTENKNPVIHVQTTCHKTTVL